MTWNEMLTASPSDIAKSEELGTVKEYLKIDGDDDNAVLITCVKAAIQYIIGAVGRYSEENQAAKVLLFALTQNFYENRELMQMDVQQRKRMEYTYGSLILQLQLEGGE